MIKRITKNSDIRFNVTEDSKIADKFIIKFYTIGKKNCITRTAEDCIIDSEKRYIKLNWSQLKAMQSGMLNYECMNLSADADYNDGVYNETFTRTTYYYIYTDSTSDSGATVDGLDARVTDLETSLSSETSDRQDKDNQLSAALNNEVTRATAKEDELSASIEDLRVNGGKVQDVQVNGKSVVNDKIANIDISTKAEKSELNDETTNRTNADNTLKKSIDDEVKARTNANTTLTNSLNGVDTRVKALENKEIWDFGTY